MTSISRANLLIVDDEADLRELLVEQLATDSYQIQTAVDGAQGLQMIRDAHSKGDPIDAVLSDINMPKLNGLDLLAEVRKAGLETPFVFLTGYGDKEKAVRALRLGALDFLEKPYEVEQLMRSVETATRYGLALRSLDTELKKVTQDAAAMPPAQAEDYIRARKALILMKKLNQSANVKKSA